MVLGNIRKLKLIFLEKLGLEANKEFENLQKIKKSYIYVILIRMVVSCDT